MATSVDGLVFLHVPKAGTSFSLSLFEYGCRYKSEVGLLHLMNDFRAGSHIEHVKAQCPGAFASLSGGHHPLLTEQAQRGHVVGMFRDPVERVASGLAHNFHDCEALQHHLGITCSANHADYSCASRAKNLTEATLMYANCVTGCMTRMLTGSACGRGEHGLSAPPAWKVGSSASSSSGSSISSSSSRDVPALAISRLRTAFQFVGDTGQWNRSVCIFCGLFSPRVQPYDYDRLFVNVRPSNNLGAVDKAKSILRTHKWHDAADQAVYHEVTAWLDQVEPRLQDNARYRECRAEWWKRRQRA
mmetsp:Transcript_42859/g.141881  ORF Transcript_42859/g.141881 Transcript_42859/m.141881 type:complete len:302 (+) Transcript_42859:56-961(+)|eukprot:CAMPEP_0196684184 /NCGR_PEP_ID=MMETSP1090-20130531/10386_1 /TAXON_ID=37098 /ORGANISM="Isochrysis sp, Strain CCMP1244" /LENGTH=301 /DNA_ID=CAMNT_0042022651 /DNA_START=1 /DNA_END=906 /DNA_ORIENTATION=+